MAKRETRDVQVIPMRDFLDRVRETDTLRPEDRTQLVAIEDAGATERAGMIYRYYKDADRADRTPRPFLYLHIGMLAGMLHTEGNDDGA